MIISLVLFLIWSLTQLGHRSHEHKLTNIIIARGYRVNSLFFLSLIHAGTPMLFKMLRTEAAHYFMEQSQWNHAILFKGRHCSFQKQRSGALWVTSDGNVLQGVFKCMCVLCVYCGFIGADASLAGLTRRPLLWKVIERSAWILSYLLSHSYSLLAHISQYLSVLASPHLSFIFPPSFLSFFISPRFISSFALQIG